MTAAPEHGSSSCGAGLRGAGPSSRSRPAARRSRGNGCFIALRLGPFLVQPRGAGLAVCSSASLALSRVWVLLALWWPKGPDLGRGPSTGLSAATAQWEAFLQNGFAVASARTCGFLGRIPRDVSLLRVPAPREQDKLVCHWPGVVTPSLLLDFVYMGHALSTLWDLAALPLQNGPGVQPRCRERGSCAGPS